MALNHKNISSYLLSLIFAFTFFTPTNGQVIDYSSSVKIEKGKQITEKSFVIQINDKESNWLSEVEIPHGADQAFEFLEAYVVGTNGKIARKLKKKEITTRSYISNGTFYQDNFIKAFNLSWNEYPYQIKYKYRITDKEFVYVSRWYPIIYKNVPTLSASLRVELPIDYEVSMDYPADFLYQTEVLDGKQIHKWELKNFKLSKTETFSPPVTELIPSVSIVPKAFKYSVSGSMESWNSYGSWHAQLNENADNLPANEGRKIDQLVAGVSDKRGVVERLYYYLQDNTRYINVAIDVGGLKPYPATYVCEKKYGDCKALTIYMKALLKQVGIPSFYTIVYAGSNPVRINRDLPSQQFNHVILAVPINGDTIWLENTANYLPYNYLGTFTQNRHALLVDGENSRLVKTPSLDLEEVLEKASYRFRLDEEGNGRINISRYLKGNTFETYRHYKHSLSEQDQKAQIEKDIRLNHFELKEWEFKQFDRGQRALELELVLEVSSQLRKVNHLRVIQPKPMEIPKFEDPELRKTPVRINFPINKSDSLIYDLPFIDKYQVEMPDNTTIETKYGKYVEQYARTGKQIVVLRSFQLFRGDYTLETYLDFFQFIESIFKSQKQSAIILSKSQ